MFQHTLEQARLAETLGYHDLWVTEHHCIPFGINPSALTASAILLGRTKRVRVGTAVVLAPLQHPLVIAEQSALLDQFSAGRFDLGLGRGGYLKDYELLELDAARWDREPTAAARAVADYWTGKNANTLDDSGRSQFEPPPLSQPHPPLFLATQSPDGVRYAAENGLPLQHYFPSPVEARLQIEQACRQHNDAPIAHLHTLIVVVGKDEERLRERDQLGMFVEQTGAERLVLYMESIADPAVARQSVITFAEHLIA